MDVRHLRTFVKAIECENFTRAAEALEVTQAGVSKHIASLEQELNATLFERHGRRAIPTRAGKRLYDYAQRILELVDEARREFGKLDSSIQGTLRIATSTAPAECVLPELLADFQAAHPGVQVALAVTDSERAAEAVISGKADLGLVGELPRSSDLTARPIASDELVLIVPTSHSCAGQKSISAERLRSEPLIVREPGSGSRRCVERYLEEADVLPRDLTIALEMNSNEAIRGAVQRGMGVAFQSRGAIDKDVAAGRLAALKVRGLTLKRRLYAITASSRAESPAVATFLRFLEAK